MESGKTRYCEIEFGLKIVVMRLRLLMFPLQNSLATSMRSSIDGEWTRTTFASSITIRITRESTSYYYWFKKKSGILIETTEMR